MIAIVRRLWTTAAKSIGSSSSVIKWSASDTRCCSCRMDQRPQQWNQSTKGQEYHALLDGRDRSYCMRRLSSPTYDARLRRTTRRTIEHINALPHLRPEDGTSPTDGGIPQCDAYKNDDVYGYCIYKFAGGFPNIAEVERLCPMAGQEKECVRMGLGRMNASSGVDMDTLLEVCWQSWLHIWTHRFSSQSRRRDSNNYCINHVGPYIRDCLGHAMQRWWYTAPDAEEVARVANVKSYKSIAFYVAASVACSGIGTCDGDPKWKHLCKCRKL